MGKIINVLYLNEKQNKFVGYVKEIVKLIIDFPKKVFN